MDTCYVLSLQVSINSMHQDLDKIRRNYLIFLFSWDSNLRSHDSWMLDDNLKYQLPYNYNNPSILS